MRTVLLTLFLSLILPLSSFAQHLSDNYIPEDLLKGRVKQVEEFIARFNHEEDWEGKKVKDPTDSLLRSKYLHTLFDYSRFRNKDGKLSPIAEQFIHDVVRNRYQIHFTDTSWVAKVQCKALVSGNKYPLTLYLQVEKIAEYEYAWVISNIDGSLFNSTSSSSHRLIISPVEHEIGFMGLLSLPTKKGYVTDRIFPKHYSPDKLSMLDFLLKNGMIKITDIENLTFHFFNIPGYAFTIERLNRKGTYNTGWLITSLNTM